MNWAARSADNILPLSKEKHSLAKALSEWIYTGEMYDLEAPIESCELCEHPHIRYQFEIWNGTTKNALLVGSECINKFEIKAVDDQGDILDTDASRKKVNRDKRHLVNEASKKRLINALLHLLKEDEDFEIETFITYVQDRGAFTPSQLSTILWRLNKNKINYNTSDFKLTIRRDREQAQLKAMDDWKIKKLWPCLSPSQKNWVKKNTSVKL